MALRETLRAAEDKTRGRVGFHLVPVDLRIPLSRFGRIELVERRRKDERTAGIVNQQLTHDIARVFRDGVERLKGREALRCREPGNVNVSGRSSIARPIIT